MDSSVIIPIATVFLVRFSRYLILDFSHLFWKNTLGLNDYVH